MNTHPIAINGFGNIVNIDKPVQIYTVTTFPSPNNKMSSVVQGIINTEFGLASDIGMADAESAGSSRPLDIIECARQDCISKIGKASDVQRQITYDTQVSIPQVQHTQFEHQQKRNSGGGGKPISEGQVKYIGGLCKQKSLDKNVVSRQICDKDFSELSGRDADIIIKQIK